MNVAEGSNVGGLHVGVAGLLQQLGEALEAEDLGSCALDAAQLCSTQGGSTLLHHRVLNPEKNSDFYSTFIEGYEVTIIPNFGCTVDYGCRAKFPQMLANLANNPFAITKSEKQCTPNFTTFLLDKK